MVTAAAEEEEALEASPTVCCIHRVKTVVADKEMTTVVEAAVEMGVDVAVALVVDDRSNTCV